MNSEIIIHPKLQHYGLITANLDTMIDWYRKVLGMTINHRSLVPAQSAIFSDGIRQQRRGQSPHRIL